MNQSKQCTPEIKEAIAELAADIDIPAAKLMEELGYSQDKEAASSISLFTSGIATGNEIRAANKFKDVDQALADLLDDPDFGGGNSIKVRKAKPTRAGCTISGNTFKASTPTKLIEYLYSCRLHHRKELSVTEDEYMELLAKEDFIPWYRFTKPKLNAVGQWHGITIKLLKPGSKPFRPKMALR